MPSLGERGEGDQGVAGVGDRRIGEHALDAVLAQSTQVADGHRERGHDPNQQQPMGVQLRIGAVGQAQEHGEGSDLGPGGHQGDHRGRRALIHVGSPDLEGRGRNLEAKADQNHGHGKSGKARD